MVTLPLHCPHCHRNALVRNGHVPNGKQFYRCRACRRQSRENPTPHASPPTRREEILHAYQERSSLRDLTRTFGVSRTTVSSWIKKGAQLPPLCPTLLAPNPDDPASPTLELDERMARLSSNKPTMPGFEWPSAVRRGKWSPLQLGSEQKDGSALVGSHCRGIAPRTLLHRLLGDLCGGNPQGAAYHRGKRDRRNRPCGAVE